MTIYWKREMHPPSEQNKKKKLNPANDPACFHPEMYQGNTQSSSTNLPAHCSISGIRTGAQSRSQVTPWTLSLPESLPSVIHHVLLILPNAPDPSLCLMAVTFPPPSTLPPRAALPAQTLAGSLTSELLHTSRFTTVTAGGGRGLYSLLWWDVH